MDGKKNLDDSASMAEVGIWARSIPRTSEDGLKRTFSLVASMKLVRQ